MTPHSLLTDGTPAASHHHGNETTSHCLAGCRKALAHLTLQRGVLGPGALGHRPSKMENIVEGPWSQTTKVCLLVLSPFSSRWTLGKSLALSELWLLSPQNGIRMAPSFWPSHPRFCRAW